MEITENRKLDKHFNQDDLIRFVDELYILSQGLARIYFEGKHVNLVSANFNLDVELEFEEDHTVSTPTDFWVALAQGKNVY